MMGRAVREPPPCSLLMRAARSSRRPVSYTHLLLEESGGSGAEELCQELEDELLEEEELELLLGLSLIHI